MCLPIQNRLSLAVFAAGLCAAPFAVAMTPADLSARLARNERLLVVDVRSSTAYTEGHIPGAINIPLSLLAHKRLPASDLVIVYGDGLGVIDDAKALALVKGKPGVTADRIDGGYAAWLAETRLSTEAAGVNRESVPGITYDQLIAANRDDVILVDLRTPVEAPVMLAARGSGGNGRSAASASPADALGDFARQLAVPVVSASTEAAPVAARGQRMLAASTPARGASVADLGEPGKLLVLVADNDSDANEAARQLRASGHYRFTVLIGGTEAIVHEGRTGSGRMDGALPVTPSQP